MKSDPLHLKLREKHSVAQSPVCGGFWRCGFDVINHISAYTGHDLVLFISDHNAIVE